MMLCYGETRYVGPTDDNIWTVLNAHRSNMSSWLSMMNTKRREYHSVRLISFEHWLKTKSLASMVVWYPRFKGEQVQDSTTSTSTD